MIIRRSIWSQLFLFLPTIVLWVSTAVVFHYAFGTYRYWQIGYSLLGVCLLLVAVVFTNYCLELGRIEIRDKRLLAFTPLGNKWIDVGMDEITGYAIAEGDAEGIPVYNLVLDTPEGIKHLSLFGMSSRQYLIRQQVPRNLFRKELIRKSSRRDIAYVGCMFLMIGIGGLIWAGFNSAIAREDPGAIAQFKVTIEDYDIDYNDGDWTETTLTVAGGEDFDFVVDGPYFTEEEMEYCLTKVDDGYSSQVSIWTYDKLYREKVRNESVGLGWWHKHYGYGQIPVLKMAVGARECGDDGRGQEFGSNSGEYTTSYLGAGFLLVGAAILLFTKRRNRKRRFTES